MRETRIIFKARPTRAIIEAGILGLICLVFLIILNREGSVSRLILAMNLPGTFWLALRLRHFSGKKWRLILFDMAVVGTLSIVISLLRLFLLYIPLFTFYIEPMPRTSSQEAAIFLLTLFANLGIYICSRTAVYLWLLWDQKRRRSLLWGLTHAQLMIAATGASLIILILNLLLFFFAPGHYAFVTTIALGLMTVVSVAIAIPPAALISFIAVRPITGRLRMLTEAAGTLRRGNYAIRVPVVGEDEVAQLQADFNAMAASLELAMRDLQKERDTVASLLQVRRELIANVSHELRTPVSILRGYLETTLMHWDGTSQATLRHDLQIMEDEVVHLQKLVEDLFTFSRAELGRLKMQLEAIDPGKIIQRIAEASAPLYWQSSKIELIADVPEHLPQIMADAVRLEQALRNLVQNGVRHTPPGGIVALTASQKGGMLFLQVKDTGEGIASKDLPYIWDRFYQTGSVRTRQGGGTGLGLALVKEWIEAMHGSVDVESTIGQGSCFTICFPSIVQARQESLIMEVPTHLNLPAQ